MRPIDWAVSLVCRVAKTRCPVSATVRANRMDSRSRISPTSSTSGSSRRTLRSASGKLAVSVPTSRWLTADILWSWTYSIGSSMVMMWQPRLLLITSTSEASVVDLPEPVGPVIRIRPWCRRARSRSTCGNPSSSGDGIERGIIRSATAVSPRWVNALPRMRAFSRHEKEKLYSWLASQASVWSGVSTSASSALVSSAESADAPGTGVKVPSTRSMGGRPTERSRSVPPACHRAASSPSIRLPIWWTVVCMVAALLGCGLVKDWIGRAAAARGPPVTRSDGAAGGQTGGAVDRGGGGHSVGKALQVLGGDQGLDGGRVVAVLGVPRLGSGRDGLAASRLRRVSRVLPERADAEHDDGGQDAEDGDDDQE